MKHRALNIVAMLGAAALLACPALLAQSEYLKANIPFDFMVGANTLPAGTYQVKCTEPSNAVVFQATDVKAALVAMSIRSRSATIPVTGKLIFTRYGDTYFLAQIWRPGIALGNLLPKSKAEKEMAARIAGAPPKWPSASSSGAEATNMTPA